MKKIIHMKFIIKLRTIKNSDYQFLYDLLLERKNFVNINHKKLPTFREHENFIKSKPYEKWYIIIDDNNIKLGTIYLTKKSEIGIFIKNSYSKLGIGSVALQLLISKNPKKIFYANINPQNTSSMKFFKKNGFKPLKFVFELNNEKKHV